MQFGTVNNLLNLNVLPKWLGVKEFTAKTTLHEKISRVANILIFGAVLYAAYAFVTGKSDVIACTSYLLTALAARKVASTLIGYCAYPATLKNYNDIQKSSEEYEKHITALKTQGYQVNNISLHKSGVKYDAVLIASPNTINNGRWTIRALGNCMAYEESLFQCLTEDSAYGCNSLLINGPGVCKSKGHPTRYQMGAAFEAGISFLEEEVKPSSIIMYGFSLGGGMMGEAILNHDFSTGLKNNIRYLSICDRSFSSLSAAAEGILTKFFKNIGGSVLGTVVGKIVKTILVVTGAELDTTAAAYKLSRLNIPQIIIQHTSINADLDDGVISDRASLAYELRKNKDLKHKNYVESERMDHNSDLLENQRNIMNDLVERFHGGTLNATTTS